MTFNFQTCQWRALTEGRRGGPAAVDKIQVRAWFITYHIFCNIQVLHMLGCFQTNGNNSNDAEIIPEGLMIWGWVYMMVVILPSWGKTLILIHHQQKHQDRRHLSVGERPWK